MQQYQSSQSEKASSFRAQHQNGKLLLLPNIWDVPGARLLERIGFPSVATASIATALANGYSDGEKIPFRELLQLVRKISSAVSIPLSVDIERGFAAGIPELKDNIQRLIENGAVGVNIEDSMADNTGLFSIDEQCRKIEAVRETGLRLGVSIVINARTDSFLLKPDGNILDMAVERGLSYKKAGADCIYPIMMNSYEDIEQFIQQVDMPVNVNLQKSISDLARLEKSGVSRISVGPQLMNHALSAMKRISEGLLNYDSSLFFDGNLLSRGFLDSLAI